MYKNVDWHFPEIAISGKLSSAPTDCRARLFLVLDYNTACQPGIFAQRLCNGVKTIPKRFLGIKKIFLRLRNDISTTLGPDWARIWKIHSNQQNFHFLNIDSLRLTYKVQHDIVVATEMVQKTFLRGSCLILVPLGWWISHFVTRGAGIREIPQNISVWFTRTAILEAKSWIITNLVKWLVGNVSETC